MVLIVERRCFRFSRRVGWPFRAKTLFFGLSRQETFVKAMISPAFFIESKVPGLKDVDFGARHVSLVCLRTGDGERTSYFPKLREGRLIIAQPFFARPGTTSHSYGSHKTNPFECPPGRVDSKSKTRQSRCPDPDAQDVETCPHGGCELLHGEKSLAELSLIRRAIPPKCPPSAPQRRQALLVGNRILNDDGLDLFGWASAIRNPTGPP